MSPTLMRPVLSVIGAVKILSPTLTSTGIGKALPEGVFQLSTRSSPSRVVRSSGSLAW
ncbi:hypothetical protein D3C87_1997330 [compost metagenome]